MNRQSMSPAPHPLRVMFLHTSFVVGGAETLMLNLIRRLDSRRFAAEICCLKELGPLGELLSHEVPATERLIRHKYDAAVVLRLAKLMRRRQIDAVVCVGAGDKMFWGRLAARWASVPVFICGIHSTGWPDRIGRLNRLLTPLTDAFVGVAEAHGRYLIDVERFPADRVHVIPNGVDTDRFAPRQPERALRAKLGIPAGPVAGTVARLSPEKNVPLMLEAIAHVRNEFPDSQLVIIGDGPERPALEARAAELGIESAVHFLGWRNDIEAILPMFDAFLLTSHIEANPVSILEALSAAVPVVATRVGSVPETVREGAGYVVEPGDREAVCQRLGSLFRSPEQARAMGQEGRRLVQAHWSLDAMVSRYEGLIEGLYAAKRPAAARRRSNVAVSCEPEPAAHCSLQPAEVPHG